MKRTIRLAVLTLLLAMPVVPVRAAPDHIILAIPAELVQLLPLYVAEDTGLWDKAGLEVKIVTIPSVGGMNAVIAGSADFSFSTGAAITRAAAHGQKLVAIVELADESGQIIILRKDLADAAHYDPAAPLPVRAQILKGRTMAIGGVASIADAFLRVVAHAAGIDNSAIVTTPMSSSEQMAAFARHALDGFVSGAPFGQQAVHDGTGVVIADGSTPVIPELSPSAAGLLVTRPGYCGDHRSICEHMGHSMVEAVNFIDAQPKQALALLHKHFPGIDEAVLAASFDAVKKMTPRPPLTSVQGLANSELINVRAGFLPPEQRIGRYDDLFTNEFVK